MGLLIRLQVRRASRIFREHFDSCLEIQRLGRGVPPQELGLVEVAEHFHTGRNFVRRAVRLTPEIEAGYLERAFQHAERRTGIPRPSLVPAVDLVLLGANPRDDAHVRELRMALERLERDFVGRRLVSRRASSSRIVFFG